MGSAGFGLSGPVEGCGEEWLHLKEDTDKSSRSFETLGGQFKLHTLTMYR